MLLRKHLQNGRITKITQPRLERILHIHIEHLDEMGDLCQKRLVVEIMGKHSNIIFINDRNMVIDSIKHISGMVSSVREVLPGRDYFVPLTQDKADPFILTLEDFKKRITGKAMPIYKALYSAYTGLSPVISHEICTRADLMETVPLHFLESPEGETMLSALYQAFEKIMKQVKDRDFSPNIVYENGNPAEYASIPLISFGKADRRDFSSISKLLESYYAEKNQLSRIRQKSVDLRKIVQTALERNIKKYDLQLRQMKDTEKRTNTAFMVNF